jgi:hypothetical protein
LGFGDSHGGLEEDRDGQELWKKFHSGTGFFVRG